MIVFAVIGGIGVVLLLAAMLIDGVADAFTMLDGLDVANGIFSGTAIGSGLTLFGACGVGALSTGVPLWVAILASVALGIAGLLLVAKLGRTLRSGSAAVPVLAIGATGRAVGPISPIGEVLIDRELNKRLARTDGPAIPDGARIRVIERQDPYLIVIADETAPASPIRWPVATPSKEK